VLGPEGIPSILNRGGMPLSYFLQEHSSMTISPEGGSSVRRHGHNLIEGKFNKLEN
jgi:hypothetical protein